MADVHIFDNFKNKYQSTSLLTHIKGEAISGIITDSVSKKPISGAKIVLIKYSSLVVTTFRIDMWPK